MADLELNFLDNPHLVDQPDLISVLEKYGSQISKYGKEYFNHLVTSSSYDGSLLDFSLYILAPEIGFEYRVITVDVISVYDLRITYYVLSSNNTESFNINISEGLNDYENKIKSLLSSNLFNASLKFLVDQIMMKREYIDENKIVPGQAVNIISENGGKMAIGIIRVEDDEIVYYTENGLISIFLHKKSPEQKIEAERLKTLSESELMELGYIEKRNFKDMVFANNKAPD